MDWEGFERYRLFTFLTAIRGDLVGGSCYFETISDLTRFGGERPRRGT